MISAMEAWQIAMPAREAKYQKHLNDISKSIKERSKTGYTYASYNLAPFEPEQVDRLIEELNKAGYRVRRVLGSILEIYWDKEEKK